MTQHPDRPNTVPWPPILYLAALAAGIVLQWLVPLPFVPPPLSEILFAVGWLVVAGALALAIAAARALHRAGTTIMANRATQRLVTAGPFCLTRNPIYLGITMLTIGVGLIAGIWWLLLSALIAAFATVKLAVEPEERHLEARFGKAWRDYARKVRRWI